MAQVTVPIAGFAGGLVTVSIRYNDQTRAINQVSVANNSNYSVFISASKPGYATQERTIGPNTSQTHNISNLGFQWLEDEGLDVHGDPLGYNLSLGDIILQSRWPA